MKCKTKIVSLRIFKIGFVAPYQGHFVTYQIQNAIYIIWYTVYSFLKKARFQVYHQDIFTTATPSNRKRYFLKIKLKSATHKCKLRGGSTFYLIFIYLIVRFILTSYIHALYLYQSGRKACKFIEREKNFFFSGELYVRVILN